MPGTTARPPGQHLLDETQFGVNFIGDSTTLAVRWAVNANSSKFNINVTVEYYESYIGDCKQITNPLIISIQVHTNGSYNITNLLPWRQYVIKVEAKSIDYNITDCIRRDVISPEQAPASGTSNIRVNSITKHGGTVMWSPPLCPDRGGVLLYYQLDVYTTSPSLTFAQSFTTNQTVHLLNSLKSYTNYGVSVVYANAKGNSTRSVLSQFRTLEYVPGTPEITEVTSDMTTISVTLRPPTVTNGILLVNVVSWSENDQFMNSVSKSQMVGQGAVLVLENLKPATQYYLRARAGTSVGFGNYSQVLKISTKPTASAPPTDLTFDPKFRNETCARISWTPPVIPDIVIIGFNVSYQEKGTGQTEIQKMFTNVSFAVVCNLNPGRYYDIDVLTSSEAGYGLSASIQVSTEQANPPAPPPPEVLNTTATSIGVALDPVVVASSTLSYGYLVFVHELLLTHGNAKRSIGISNETCPGVNDVPGNIVRNFTQSEILTRTGFIIGDGKTYGLYENKALTKDKYYDIYYVITSYFQGICKYSYTKTATPVKAAPPVVLPQVTPSPETVSDNTIIIVVIVVIVVLVLLILIAVIIVLVCCWYRKGQAELRNILR